ncbi:hypothetical protein [Cohnella yongneupensis]|uniref:Nicotinic acid mononucleotide adenylyltransferase n=1 Tax=Cohnella yongneupensis TaxID=425006 RepID=A0ABW0R243_9BACL
MTERVPYGYNPPADKEKGTLIYYDTFEHATDDSIAIAAAVADDRSFARLVLYPIHEETAKRMSKEPVSPYYKREKRLSEWLSEFGSDDITLDGWEGKRKKYTPMEAALRHLTETLPAPHFVMLAPETANLFASFASFEEWIVRVRLIVTSEPRMIHPRLDRYRHRWEAL